jgi:hypothetical protein
VLPWAGFLKFRDLLVLICKREIIALTLGLAELFVIAEEKKTNVQNKWQILHPFIRKPCSH